MTNDWLAWRILLSLATTTAVVGPASAQDGAVASVLSDIGVDLGFGFEFEAKRTDNYGFSDETDWTRSAPLAKASLAFPNFNGKLFYTLKFVNKIGDSDRYESEGFKHDLIFGRNFALGHGFTGGVYYDASLETARRDQDTSTDLKERTLTQKLRPTLSYASSDGKWGFYSQAELFRTSTDNEVYWTSSMYRVDKKGATFLIEPYYKMGNLKFSTEIYHQHADNTTTVGDATTQLDTFTETYIQPRLSYSIPDAGVLSITARLTEKETMINGGAWSTKGTYYRSDVRKVSLGYEQTVGDWRVNAKVQRSWETEVSNSSSLSGLEKDTIQDKVELSATLRF